MSKIIAPLFKASTLGMVDLDPSTPRLPKANEAPDPEATNKAESRRLQRKKRSGRTSTVLTGGSSTLG